MLSSYAMKSSNNNQRDTLNQFETFKKFRKESKEYDFKSIEQLKRFKNKLNDFSSLVEKLLKIPVKEEVTEKAFDDFFKINSEIESVIKKHEYKENLSSDEKRKLRLKINPLLASLKETIEIGIQPQEVRRKPSRSRDRGDLVAAAGLQGRHQPEDRAQIEEDRAQIEEEGKRHHDRNGDYSHHQSPLRNSSPSEVSEKEK